MSSSFTDGCAELRTYDILSEAAQNKELGLMRDYELTLVVDPEGSEEDRKKQTAKIEKIIEDLKGKVEEIDEWGKKKLAYPIKKKNLGYYFLWTIKLPEEVIMDLDKKLRLEEGLLRYLLVRREKR